MKLGLLSLAAVGLVAMPMLASASSDDKKKPERRVCIEEADTGSNMRRSRPCPVVDEKEARRRQSQLEMDGQRSAPRGYVDDLPSVPGSGPK